MDLRSDLMPIELDEALVARLTELAASLDGAAPGMWEDDLAEFNRLAGTSIPFEHFQGIYGGEEHEDYVRRVLTNERVKADPNITQEEMAEIATRAMFGPANHDFYLQLFLVNCKHPAGMNLLYFPEKVPELPAAREPTVEEIAALAIGNPLNPEP